MNLNVLSREEKISEILFQRGEISPDELAKELDVSVSTIRRDIQALSSKGLVEQNRTTIRIATVIRYDSLPFYTFPVDMAEARVLADYAAHLVSPGDVVGLSGGLICTQLALRLRHYDGITVVTNALNVAAELAPYPNIRVRLTGGQINFDSFELVGQAVSTSLQGIWINKFFLGTNGITKEHGVTGRDEVEAQAARTLMEHASSTIVLADSKKFLQPNFATVAPLSAVDTIVTTSQIPPQVLSDFQATGINILVASCS